MTDAVKDKAPARIYVAGEPDDADITAVFASIRSRGAEPATMHRSLAAAPKVMAAVFNLAMALRHDTIIPRPLGELIILRTVQLEGGHYEYAAHKKMALTVGLTPEQIADLEHWRESSVFTPKEKAVLAYADALSERGDVADGIYDALASHFNEREIVELTVTVGFYVQVARFSSGVAMQSDH